MTRHQLPGIVRDPAPLSEDHLPKDFVGRESQIEEFLRYLKVEAPGSWPVSVWVHGPPGGGKTSAVRRVLGQLETGGVRTAYVNCWSSQTFYSVLDALFTELRQLVAEMRDVSFKFERLSRIAREKPLVIVLDEVDQMFLKNERNATIYNLTRLDHSALVCLTQSRTSYLSLDPRVQSRLQPRFLEFPPYSTDEVLTILGQRAEQALEPDTWCQADLKRIADASGGDARVAIQTLRIAAYLAEKGKANQLRTGDVEQGLLKSGELRRIYVLKGLSEHHRLLHHIVKEAGEISLAELWKRYRDESAAAGFQPMAKRTFNYYKQHLVNARLLKERQGKGRRNVIILQVFE
ncbi:MAG: AAA family ATPase [Candidatus Eisenbacteria bacterium]|nr:AAA family ATPase [Candidatus Eisenbacteria bacterium]